MKMTDAKPVADLRREAHEVIDTWDVWHDGETSPDCFICILADRAEAAEKAAFGEHTLAQEWQGRAEAAERERDMVLRHLHATGPDYRYCAGCGESLK